MIDQIIQFFYSLLFFVIPILMSKDTSELFEFNKMLFIYAATVFIAFFWFLKMILHKKIILKKTALDIPIIVFFLSQLISTIFSLDRHTSIFGYYGRFNGGLLSTLSYIILYYAFISNQTNIEKTLKAILTPSLLIILWAVPGKFSHDLTCLLFTGQFNNSCWDNSVLAFRPELRAFSTLGQPNWLGAYLSVCFFVGVYFLIKNSSFVKTSEDKQNFRSKLKSLIWPIYLFLNFSMILFTRSRSALLAVLIGLALFTGYYLFFVKWNTKRILAILLLVTVIPILFFKTGEDKIDKYLSISNIKNEILKIQSKNQNNDSNLSSNIQDQESNNVTESFDIRKIVWEGAWKLALKYPLFGTGVETFAYSYNFVRPVAHNLTSEWDYVYNKAHNEDLNYLATTGFVGLGAYLLLIFSFLFLIFWELLKFKFKNKSLPLPGPDQSKLIAWIPSYEGMTVFNSEILTLSLFCGWLTILITNFFGFSTTTIQLFLFLVPALIITGNRQQEEITKVEKINAFQLLTIFAIAFLAIYLIFSITVYYLADVNYSLGLKYSKINDQQKAALYFEKALKLRNEPVYEDKFSASLAYLSAITALQNQKDLAKQIAALSDSYNRKTIQLYPKNVFYWKTRAKNMYYFYQITGDSKELLEGIRALKTAENLSPADPKIPYSLSLYYSIIYDTTKNISENEERLSLREINKTINLKSNFREAYLYKGQLLKKYGKIEEAKKVFEYMLRNFNKNDGEVIKELQTL